VTEPVERSFLGLSPEEQPTYEEAGVVLQPVPYEGTVSYAGGTAAGPGALVAASSQVELWDLELGREPWTVGIHLATEVAPLDGDPALVVDRVEAACQPACAAGKLVVTLGGEHSVTVGAARAAAQRASEPLTFLVIDAHLDLRDSYDGTPYSHACTSRRLLELGRVVHVGVRTACPEELEVIAAHGLAPIWGHEVHAAPSNERWIARALDQLEGPVYVSVDVDGLDPSVIPATGTPVPGGLGWYDLLALLRAVGERCDVVGCDLVELAPIPGQVASDFAAALLAYKMIGYFAPATRG
jgi:N1-aminopropylagmatine ureohydrolase